jgi:threonine dehydratase
MDVTLAKIQAAREELSKHMHPSPLLWNGWLSELFGCQVYLKLENMQPIGSFKIRGATYKISKLSEAQKKQGVIAASAGNHAQGVAWGSRKLGVKALIVMPTVAPLVKIHNTKTLGAEVVLKGTNYEEAYIAAKELEKETHRILIHAFEDETVIAGQGTIGLEILEQLPDVDYVIGALGGGGMMAGIATVFRALKPQTQIIAGQASRCASMVKSIQQGHVIQIESPNTFADGIAVGKASESMRKILEPLIDEWCEVDDEAIAAGVLTLMEKAKIVAEGSGAVPLACLDQIKEKVRGKKIVLVVSGGNIDVNVLSRIIDLGLIRSGRRVRINVLLLDRPGSLAHLTDLIAKQGANILQAIHDRNEPSAKIDQAEVALTLETKGPEHSAALIEALRKNVLRLELTH